MQIKLTNIANIRRDIYLFSRDDKGNQKIDNIKDFFPFFYELDKEKGNFISYDGQKLRKVFCSQPGDIAKMRTFNSYSSDIKFVNNYLVSKVDVILPTTIKYCFIDIEILANELPEANQAKFPVSCITIYNSFDKKIHTWYLGDQEGSSIKEKEKLILDEFVRYMAKERFDIWFSWNSSFDYNYLYNRIPDFAKKISPIHYIRTGEDRDIFYPAGLSVIDYLKFFKKVYMREGSYALDYIAEKHLGKGKEFKNVDFSKLSDIIKKRNIGDVQILIDLENKYKIIPYYDEIRRITKCQWEDLYHNSRLVEMLLFEEAKIKNVILPNKQNKNEIIDTDEIGFQGATRNIAGTGIYRNIGKCDLSSAYPSMIVNFCLDTANVVDDEADFEMYGGIKINDNYFKQDTNALLPSIVKKMLVLKDKLKKLKKENKEDKNIAIKYDAIKSIVNSLFGVTGSPYFRLYDTRIASTITFLVRDLLMYVKDKVEQRGIKVIYFDTDSLFFDKKEDISKELNQYIKDWAKEKFNKDTIDLKFEYEGYFEKLFVLGICHYYGYIANKPDPEIKGIEAKRSSSSKYEAWFQEELINKVLNNSSRENIDLFLLQEQERIKNLPLEEISFPAKLTNKEYKNLPIFIRAFNNTLKIKKDFKVNIGEIFYYLFTNDKNEVLAFTKDDKNFINKNIVDYSKIIDRNIFGKAEKIYEAMNWYLNRSINQLALF